MSSKSDRRMDGGDWFWSVIFYLIVGFLVYLFGALIGEVPMGEHPDATTVGVIVLWPLFAVKWLCMGVYAVFAAGFSALI